VHVVGIKFERLCEELLGLFVVTPVFVSLSHVSPSLFECAVQADSLHVSFDGLSFHLSIKLLSQYREFITYLFAVTNGIEAQTHVVPGQFVRVIEFSGLFEVIQSALEVLLFVVDQTSLMIHFVVLL
jgi:hypothetical protein